jgi:hypothetical protein
MSILKQRLKIFWSITPTNFSYEPPLQITLAHKETDVFKQMIEKPLSITWFEGTLQTTGRLSLLTPSNPPPRLKFFF